jgi:hypothetical protein
MRACEAVAWSASRNVVSPTRNSARVERSLVKDGENIAWRDSRAQLLELRAFRVRHGHKQTTHARGLDLRPHVRLLPNHGFHVHRQQVQGLDRSRSTDARVAALARRINTLGYDVVSCRHCTSSRAKTLSGGCLAKILAYVELHRGIRAVMLRLGGHMEARQERQQPMMKEWANFLGIGGLL